MMGIEPLEVTVLGCRAFGEYYLKRRGEGFDLAQRRPPRVNAPDEVIKELMGEGRAVSVV
jgi:hypothetical protein